MYFALTDHSMLAVSEVFESKASNIFAQLHPKYSKLVIWIVV